MRNSLLRNVSILALTAPIVAGLSFVTPAAAEETETYTYDVHGRLVKVERDGDVNDGVDTDYEYDDADNRTEKDVTGVPE